MFQIILLAVCMALSFKTTSVSAQLLCSTGGACADNEVLLRPPFVVENEDDEDSTGVAVEECKEVCMSRFDAFFLRFLEGYACGECQPDA